MKHLSPLSLRRGAAALLLLLPAAVSAQAYVEMANKTRVPVERISVRPADGSMVVVREGQTINLTRDQYIRAQGIRPAQLDEAIALIAQGKSKEAQEKLNEVMRISMYQTWDVVAGVSLANLQNEDGNPIGARTTLDTLLKRYGENSTTIFPQLIPLEWRTRIAQGQVAGLEEELTTLTNDNRDRARSAQALIVRGDLKRKRADLKAAMLDYLRTTYFYSQDEAATAEALFKVGDTFRELGENANAARYFNELKTRYPTSEFAARIPGA
jgi:tetratricopeptide (TPR) repeat protein